MPAPRRKQILLLLSGVALLGVVLAWWMHKAPEKPVVLTLVSFVFEQEVAEAAENAWTDSHWRPSS